MATRNLQRADVNRKDSTAAGDKAPPAAARDPEGKEEEAED